MNTAPNARKRSQTAAAFASQIRAERAAKGWTQDQLAKASGLSRRTVMRIEGGESVADVSQVADICQALGVTIVEFFRRAENRARFEAAEQAARQELG